MSVKPRKFVHPLNPPPEHARPQKQPLFPVVSPEAARVLVIFHRYRKVQEFHLALTREIQHWGMDGAPHDPDRGYPTVNSQMERVVQIWNKTPLSLQRMAIASWISNELKIDVPHLLSMRCEAHDDDTVALYAVSACRQKA